MREDIHSSNGLQSPWHTHGGGEWKTVTAGRACCTPKRGQMRTERWWKNGTVGKPEELLLKPVTVWVYPPFIPLLDHQSPASVVKDNYLSRMVTPVSLKARACQLCHVKLSETELNAVCHDVSLDKQVVMRYGRLKTDPRWFSNAFKLKPHTHTQSGGPKALFTTASFHIRPIAIFT
jgi:hypothetical protein